jgi:PhnB protein
VKILVKIVDLTTFKKTKLKKMASVSIYITFPRNAEAAFNFYKSVFGGEFINGGMARMNSIAKQEGMPIISEENKNLVRHVELPLIGGMVLVGSDVIENENNTVNFGNNFHINLELDTKEEAIQLFTKLSYKGTIKCELKFMFWGAYYGSCTDQFGVKWMFNCNEKNAQ